MKNTDEARQPNSQRSNGDWLRHDIGIRAMKIFNIVLVALPFILCWFGYYRNRVTMFPSDVRSAVMIGMFTLLYFFFGRVYDAFQVSLKRISEMIYCQALAILLADSFMFVVLWLLSGAFPDMTPALIALVAQVGLSALWCLQGHHWYFRTFAPQNTCLVYDMERGFEDLIGEYGLNCKFNISMKCNVEECLSRGVQMLDEMDTVFLCGVHSHERNVILKHCVDKGIMVYMLPRIGDIIMSGAKRMHMFHLPILRVGRYNPTPEYRLEKRLIDIVGSALCLVIFSPIMLATAIAIKAHDGGPVFYKQDRLTKDRRVYRILKFRSMRVDAEKDGVARLSAGDKDDRITPIGRVIRRCRVDELPQLINILKGDMSIVGPRPERPEIAAQYEQEIPEFALRLQAKAGLTGYAQVYGKYNTQPYDKLQMDLMYIANPSLMEDIKIILATIRILFMRESTEGVKVEQGTAEQAEASVAQEVAADAKAEKSA